MIAILVTLGACSPGIFALGWLVCDAFRAGAFRSTASLPTARWIKRNRLPLPGDRTWPKRGGR